MADRIISTRALPNSNQSQWGPFIFTDLLGSLINHDNFPCSTDELGSFSSKQLTFLETLELPKKSDWQLYNKTEPMLVLHV
jgi:hypothetical protein